MATNLTQDSYNELSFRVSKDYESLFIELVFEFGIEAIQEDENSIIVRSSDDLSNLKWALELFKDKLYEQGKKFDFYIDLEIKPNKNWIEEYKNNIKPIQIGNFYIHCSWQKAKKDCENILVDPALAFGSGHHESTHSCIQFLQQFAKKDMQVLDLGCGSGILSIVLAKLGCKVYACDTDEQAVLSTINNAKINHIKFENIWQGSIKTETKYDLIVANIVFDVISNLKNELLQSLKSGAFLILAGIIERYKERVLEEFKDLKLIDNQQNNEWLSFVYQR